MLMTVLFYGVIVLFALVLLAWAANKLFHMWQAGVLMGGVYAIGMIVLLVQMIVYIAGGHTMTSGGIFGIFAFVVAILGCYIHFRLAGTAIAPLTAVVILLAQVAPRFVPALPLMMPLVASPFEPWIRAASVLSAVGVGITVTGALLALIAAVRMRRLDDETNEILINATLKMPKMISHFGWWSVAILSFAVGAYILWCHTIFGAYWLWQPYFVGTVVVWLVSFVAKDVLMAR